MARKSIEDVMNEIEDFMNSCKTTALSSNKVIVPRDEFDELFGDLKVKIPAEIDRCKKIMRNKEAILMDARKTADDIIAQAQAQAAQMISETAIMQQANQQAYETVELARVQANEMLGQATAESNEIRLGSMQYTNDIMIGIRNYVEATINAERANYENLIATLEQDYTVVSANIEEVQGQIIDFTGDPNSVQKAPSLRSNNNKTAANGKEVPPAPKTKQSMVQKVKNAVSGKEETTDPENAAVDKTIKNNSIEKNSIEKNSIEKNSIEKNAKRNKPVVEVPDLIATGEEFVPNETPVEATVSAKTGKPIPTFLSDESVKNEPDKDDNSEKPKKVKKVVRKRNPVLHTPQTAQETVAKTLEAAAANTSSDKAVFKANGEPARVTNNDKDTFIVTEYTGETEEKASDTKAPVGKSMGVVDDFAINDFPTDLKN